MANIKSSKRDIQQSLKRREANLARKTAIKTATKKVMIAVEQGAGAAEVQELLSAVASQLGRARGKGLMHANTAARKLSRLAKKVAQAQA